MKSIYNLENNNDLVERIQKLTPDSKALWGKMSVDQMLSHCQAPINVAFGTLPLKANFMMQVLGKMLKNKILKGLEKVYEKLIEFKKMKPFKKQYEKNWN